MTNHPKQLNLGILDVQMPDIAAICAQIDVVAKDLIEHPENWPNSILCLKLNWGNGQETMFQDFANKGNIVFTIFEKNIDEQDLFFKFTQAEAMQARLLILTFFKKQQLQIKSPDLKSRFDNVTFVENMAPTKANLAKVLRIGLQKIGVSIAPNFQARIIKELNLDFVIISQLIGYIVSKYPIGVRPNNENIGELIVGFENDIQINRLI